jgi:probable HAF family extracellular repeat protein
MRTLRPNLKLTPNGSTVASRRLRRRLDLEQLEDRCCPSYSILNLGNWTIPAAINNLGQVAGGTSSAFLWHNGQFTYLGFGDHDSSKAYDINDNGVIVGGMGGYLVYGDEIPPTHAFRWSDGVMSEIGGPNTLAVAVNNPGQIVGYRATPNGSVALLWENGTQHDLNDFLPAGSNVHLTLAQDINNHGQIVARGTVNGQGRRFVLTDDDGIYANGGAALTDLGTLDINAASRINNAGQVTGGRYLFSGGNVTNLGFFAYDINDAGSIVGTLSQRAYLWKNGQTTDLNTLIDPGAGWTLMFADGINDLGQIVGTGMIGDPWTWNGFILLPEDGQERTLTITDVAVTEGHSGTISAVFTVSLSALSAQAVQVSYQTADGAALAALDYEATSGTLVFNPGQTSKTITVNVIGDRLGEPNETFFLDLSNPVNASLQKSQGEGMILDDEPRLSIDDVTMTEGKNGTRTFVFSVSLSSPYDLSVSVNFATADGTAKVRDGDYLATSGILTFSPGQTVKTIAVVVKGDKKKEANEAFSVNLFGASSNVLLLDALGVGTILNDD